MIIGLVLADYVFILLAVSGLAFVAESMGATGPLSLSVLTKELKSKDEVVATSAVFMTISHLTKIPVFMLVTHMLWQSLELILGMVLGSSLGSFVGTKLRLKASNAELIAVINLLLTLLALHMIFAVFA
ncbi:TSUP family transporter [Pseudoalteromonas luteoviolacea]|uniref:Probable membrane transporter protein n=1 Tax=Pseudoalteromonas luteoviolacea NCIMB 1942 TaxID=1365253 RepID=A0A167DHT7_9GAMM|nr:TSUP family transporter [Pseudoalteromonas luteoviolacea]KZN48854.1 hypothetical protein N482_06885 [Pseudoalteromonas luteoviolacea NCIMB 1942]